MPPLRLVFMGSPDFSVPVLDALIKAGHEIIAVYSQPPRPADRGQRKKSSAVHAFAHRKGLDVRTISSLKRNMILRKLSKTKKQSQAAPA